MIRGTVSSVSGSVWSVRSGDSFPLHNPGSHGLVNIKGITYTTLDIKGIARTV